MGVTVRRPSKCWSATFLLRWILPESVQRLALGTIGVALIACAFIGVAPFDAASAPSRTDTELLAIHTALHDLQSEFFRPVSVSTALDSAWQATLAQAQKGGAGSVSRLSPVFGTDGAKALRSFDSAFRSLGDEAGQALDPAALGHAAIGGLASSVHENHTYFIDPSRWARRGEASTSYAGIGVSVAQVGQSVYITEVYSGSPADHAGLKRGEYVTAVDGAAVSGLTMDEVVKLLRGSPGSSVTVSVTGLGRSLQAELSREAIVVPAFESRILDGGVGYLVLRSFPPAGAKLPNGSTLGQAIDQSLASFESAGVTAWILDLRNNSGGYLDGMSEIANRLLPSGSVVMVARSRGGDQVTRSSSVHGPGPRPLTVLVNAGSASASEILAVALQENGRAKIVGDKSAGVANAANLDALPNGSGLSITSVQTLTPVLRRPLDGEGVAPDSPIAGSIDDIPLGRDRQLERAEALALAASAGRSQ
jgi:carboxyl-terminal processing protease